MPHALIAGRRTASERHDSEPLQRRRVPAEAGAAPLLVLRHRAQGRCAGLASTVSSLPSLGGIRPSDRDIPGGAAVSAAVTPLPVPRAVREQLAKAWLACDADRLYEFHREADLRKGQVYYNLDVGDLGAGWYVPPLTVRQFIKDGVIPPGALVRGGALINQHAAHSLQQFWNECGTAYARHLSRMARFEMRP